MSLHLDQTSINFGVFSLPLSFLLYAYFHSIDFLVLLSNILLKMFLNYELKNNFVLNNLFSNP